MGYLVLACDLPKMMRILPISAYNIPIISLKIRILKQMNNKRLCALLQRQNSMRLPSRRVRSDKMHPYDLSCDFFNLLKHSVPAVQRGVCAAGDRLISGTS